MRIVSFSRREMLCLLIVTLLGIFSAVFFHFPLVIGFLPGLFCISNHLPLQRGIFSCAFTNGKTRSAADERGCHYFVIGEHIVANVGDKRYDEPNGRVIFALFIS